MRRLPLLQTFFKPEAFLGLPLLVSSEGVQPCTHLSRARDHASVLLATVPSGSVATSAS